MTGERSEANDRSRLMHTPKRRGRDLGLAFPGNPGPFNAITDVPGVRVDMTTLIA